VDAAGDNATVAGIGEKKRAWRSVR
jgi:hypothetical protein